MKRILTFFRLPIDLLLSLLSLPSGIILLGYRRFGSGRLRMTTKLLKAIGVFPIRNHYYEPLFDDKQLTTPLSDDRELPGLDLNDSGQLRFASALVFADELRALALDRPSQTGNRFYMNNGSFVAGDADFLYQFLRAVKPAKVIEIGSGHSTRIAKLALDANRADDTTRATSHVCIEPYEMPWLEELGVKVLRQKVEDCDLDWANELNSGDLLFIDSSHIIRAQGDVLHEYLQIIPRLKSGVYVHVHDIFTPKDYLREWIVDRVWFWNEQYLLEALLSNVSRYEVVAALNYLKHHHYAVLKAACPYLDASLEPGSFYFRVR